MILFLLTPRAGKKNHRYLVPKGTGYQDSILNSKGSEVERLIGLENASAGEICNLQLGVVVVYQSNVRQVDGSGRLGYEFLVIADERIKNLNESARSRLIAKAKDLFQSAQAEIETRNADPNRQWRDLTESGHLIDWPQFSHEIGAVEKIIGTSRYPAPVDQSGKPRTTKKSSLIWSLCKMTIILVLILGAFQVYPNFGGSPDGPIKKTIENVNSNDKNTAQDFIKLIAKEIWQDDNVDHPESEVVERLEQVFEPDVYGKDDPVNEKIRQTLIAIINSVYPENNIDERTTLVKLSDNRNLIGKDSDLRKIFKDGNLVPNGLLNAPGKELADSTGQPIKIENIKEFRELANAFIDMVKARTEAPQDVSMNHKKLLVFSEAMQHINGNGLKEYSQDQLKLSVFLEQDRNTWNQLNQIFEQTFKNLLDCSQRNSIEISRNKIEINKGNSTIPRSLVKFNNTIGVLELIEPVKDSAGEYDVQPKKDNKELKEFWASVSRFLKKCKEIADKSGPTLESSPDGSKKTKTQQ